MKYELKNMAHMQDKIRSILLPLAVVVVLIAMWAAVWKAGVFHESAFPSPLAVEIGRAHV